MHYSFQAWIRSMGEPERWLLRGFICLRCSSWKWNLHLEEWQRLPWRILWGQTAGEGKELVCSHTQYAYPCESRPDLPLVLYRLRAHSILRMATSTKVTLWMGCSRVLEGTSLMVATTKDNGSLAATMAMGFCYSLTAVAIKEISSMA